MSINKLLFKRPKFLSIFAIFLFPIITYAAHLDDLRNQRYCEILVFTHGLNFAVYNTIGLNNCPSKRWDAITSQSIKKQTQSFWVMLNGPRHWVIDGLVDSKAINPEVRTFDGLEMREAGILHLELLDLFRLRSPYHPVTVDRKTTWVYKKNRPVYEVINEEGQVFVMQSYSLQKIPQTEASLAELASKLHLPTGWHFSTGLLKKEHLLKAINNKATVLQDEFSNTYQLAAEDFLE